MHRTSDANLSFSPQQVRITDQVIIGTCKNHCYFAPQTRAARLVPWSTHQSHPALGSDAQRDTSVGFTPIHHREVPSRAGAGAPGTALWLLLGSPAPAVPVGGDREGLDWCPWGTQPTLCPWGIGGTPLGVTQSKLQIPKEKQAENPSRKPIPSVPSACYLPLGASLHPQVIIRKSAHLECIYPSWHSPTAKEQQSYLC